MNQSIDLPHAAPIIQVSPSIWNVSLMPVHPKTYKKTKFRPQIFQNHSKIHPKSFKIAPKLLPKSQLKTTMKNTDKLMKKGVQNEV